MADRPIIFSAPMVRALIDGRKTQTRRVAKVKWKDGANADFSGWRAERVGARHWQLIGGMGVGANIAPAYAPGDRLYVREAWLTSGGSAKDGWELWDYVEGSPASQPDWVRKMPSIHMPRWASRLTLTVTDVRVQRLHDISEADAVAEGIERLKSGRGFYDPTASKAAVRFGEWTSTATQGFRTLWNSLHGPDAWDANPWVVALTFTVEQRNIDAGCAMTDDLRAEVNRYWQANLRLINERDALQARVAELEAEKEQSQLLLLAFRSCGYRDVPEPENGSLTPDKTPLYNKLAGGGND